MKTMPLVEFHDLYRDDLTIVDVREPSEYVQGHVPGAVLIPLGQLPNRKAEVPVGVPVYVICRSGNRSKVGAEVLAYAGYDAVSVDEGTMGWINRGWPVVTGTDVK